MRLILPGDFTATSASKFLKLSGISLKDLIMAKFYILKIKYNKCKIYVHFYFKKIDKYLSLYKSL